MVDSEPIACSDAVRVRPCAVVEVEPALLNTDDGIEQAKRYARKLQVPSARVTNGLKVQELRLVGWSQRILVRFMITY